MSITRNVDKYHYFSRRIDILEKSNGNSDSWDKLFADITEAYENDELTGVGYDSLVRIMEDCGHVVDD